MSRLNMNIRHGDLGVRISHGGGGDLDLGGLILPVVIIVVAAAVIEFVLSIIVWLAVASGVAVFLAAAVLAWWLVTQPARRARFAEATRAAFAALEAAEAAKVERRQQFALELARASAQPDPATLAAVVAAAIAGTQVRPGTGLEHLFQPQVIRAQVNR